MLTAIVNFAVRFKGIVIALSCMLMGYGIYAITQSRLDVFPEFAPPLVVIQTEAPGLSPEQVELLVTQHVENALSGIVAVDNMRSQSIQGLSVVTITFREDTDIYRARQLIAEQLSAVGNALPKGVKAPAMTPLTSSTSVVLGIGLTSDKVTPADLRAFADWTVKPAILGVPGVANITVYGGEIKQYQIQVDPEKLRRYGLSLHDVLAATQLATGVRGSGFIENRNQRIILDAIGQISTAEQLAQVSLQHRNGMTLRLGDIGKVVVGPEMPFGGASVQGRPGVVMMVDSQYGSDLMSVTAAVEAALKRLEPSMKTEGITLHASLTRPANFVNAALGRLQFILMIGAGLVVTVLFLFLQDVRSAVISAVAIPLSLITAVIVLHWLDFSLNTMTLGGLAIALGEVVDDAIIDVENIYRRLRENRSLGDPLPAWKVILNASVEVRGSVVYATFIVVLVFLPVLALSGVAGKLFAPLGIAYIFAVLSSLVVALTLTPALSHMLLTGRHLKSEEPRIYAYLKKHYRALLLHTERWSKAVLLGVTLLVAATVAVLPMLEVEFLPELREGHFIMHMAAVPGTSLEESLRLGKEVSEAVLAVPGVRSVAQRVGRAAKTYDVFGPHYSEFEIDLARGLGGDEQQAVLEDIQEATEQFPGVSFMTQTFLTERVQETISGYTAQVVVNIFGPDLDRLDALARQVAEELQGINGAQGVAVQAPQGTPQLSIRLKQDQLSRWGFRPVEVLDAIQVAYGGIEVAQVYEGNRVFGVAVMLQPQARQRPEDIGELPLRNPDGVMVKLSQLATIGQTNGRYVILHHGGQRLQTVTANADGVDLAAFVAEAERRLDTAIELPQGYYIAFAGEAVAQSRSQSDLIIYSLIAGAAILSLLFLAMRNTRALILVMVNIPFAVIGGVLSVLATGGLLSLGSMVGFVTLFGITLRNSIMLISHYEYLVNEGGMEWNLDTAIQGASERVAPIVMTALVTGIGLLPLAVLSGEPGNEIEGPMAIVIVGGLITSTLLNLLVLPTLALRFGRFQRQAETEPHGIHASQA